MLEKSPEKVVILNKLQTVQESPLGFNETIEIRRIKEAKNITTPNDSMRDALREKSE